MLSCRLPGHRWQVPAAVHGRLRLPFGKVALRHLFSYADKDDSSQLDKEELKEALRTLGFGWLVDEKKLEKVAG